LTLWLAVCVCVLVSFIFSGIEAGLLSVNRVRLRNRVNLRDRAALRLDRLLKEPERLLLTVVIVTNLMNIFAITLTTAAFVRRWGEAGYFIALILFLPLYLFGLELFPKSLFRRFPYRALALLSQPLKIADLLLSPLLWLGTRLAQWFVPPGEHDSRKLFAGREDFKYFTLESERTGALSPEERQLIHNVVDFRAVTARDLMRPLAEFPRVAQDSSLEAVIEASGNGTSRQLLVTSATGEIVGLVSVFESILDRGLRSRIRSFVRRVVPTPPNEPASRLIRKLRTGRSTVALVVEEGVPLGLVFRDAVYRRLLQAPEASKALK
jgi:CBS domain containing-hemolysin-like protein